MRAPTPSAAAEMVSASRDEIIQRVSVSQRRMIDALSMRIEKAHLVLNRFSRENLERNFSLIVKNYLLRLDESREVLSRSVKDLVKSAEHRVELVSNKLNANSPLTILKKGYAAVTLKRTGKILKDARNARIDDKINVKLCRGGLGAEIKEIIRDENF